MKINFNFVSPVFPSSITIILALIAFIIPNEVYQELLNERKYVSSLSLLYVILLCGSFIASFYAYLFYKKNNKVIEDINRVNLVNMCVTMMLILIISNLMVISKFVSSVGVSSITNIFFGSGDISLYFDQYSNSLQGFDIILSITLPIFSLSCFYILKYPYILNKLFMAIFYIFLLLTILRVTLRSSKGLIFALVISFIIIYLSNNKHNIAKFSLKRALIFFSALSVLVSVFFIFNSFRTRNTDYTNIGLSVESQIFGYSIGSFNRQAANMQLEVLPKSGGYNSLKWIFEMPFISSKIGLKGLGENIFNYSAPDWLDTFSLWSNHGLNRFYNQPTIFSYVYSDIWWFGFIFFALYGLLTAELYLRFIHGNLLGIFLYPMIFFQIVEWRSEYLIGNQYTQSAFLICGLLYIFSKRTKS